MAFFGAPISIEGSCERSAWSALEMIEMVDLLNVGWAVAGKEPIRIGAGIATGIYEPVFNGIRAYFRVR